MSMCGLKEEKHLNHMSSLFHEQNIKNVNQSYEAETIAYNPIARS
jgi:hypothetical protein